MTKFLAICLAVGSLHGCAITQSFTDPMVSCKVGYPSRARKSECNERIAKENDRRLLANERRAADERQRQEQRALDQIKKQERLAEQERERAEYEARQAKQREAFERQREEEYRHEEAEQARIDAIKARCGKRFRSKPTIGMSYNKWLECMPYPDEFSLSGQHNVNGRSTDIYKHESGGVVIYVRGGKVVSWQQL